MFMHSLGKKSTSAKRRPVDGSINEKVEEAKENKDGKPTVGEVRLYSFGNIATCLHDCYRVMLRTCIRYLLALNALMYFSHK